MNKDAEKLESGWYWVREIGGTHGWECAYADHSRLDDRWRFRTIWGDVAAKHCEIGPRISPPTDGEK